MFIMKISKNIGLIKNCRLFTCNFGTFKLTQIKQAKKNSLINQLIKEAKIRDAQRPKDYDSIVNDDFIKKYKEIVSKRPSNGRNIFFSEKIDRNCLDHKQEFYRVSKLWSDLTKREKRIYDNRVKVIQNEIDNNLNNLLSRLSIDEIKYFKEKIKMLNKSRRLKLRKFRIKKQQIASKMPKKPMHAYLLFLTDYLAKEQKSFSQGVLECGHKWRSLNQDDKNKYIQEAKRLMDKYREEMKIWENRMIMEGKVQLISSGTRNKIGSNLAKLLKNENKIRRKTKKNKTISHRRIRGET